MLPAVANRYNTALAVMQSITTWQQRLTIDRQKKSGQQTAVMASGLSLAPSLSSRAKAAVDDIFSVNNVSSTGLMIQIVGKIVDNLNASLSNNIDQADDSADTSIEKQRWRDLALLSDSRNAAADGQLRIPKPGENGVSFRQAAQMVLGNFNEDYLSQDVDLKKQVEDMLGFKLGTVSVLDLLQTAIDPSTVSAEKVDKVLTNGLAGEKGSKVSQRLDRAAQGSQSVDQAVANALHKSPGDEVDSGTMAEDRKAIAAAEAHDKLRKVISRQEKVAKNNKAAGESGKSWDPAQQISKTAASQDIATDHPPMPDDMTSADTTGETITSADAVPASDRSAKTTIESVPSETNEQFDTFVPAHLDARADGFDKPDIERTKKPIVRGYRETLDDNRGKHRHARHNTMIG